MGYVFLGLDLGTTGIKAVAYDDAEQPVAAAERPTPTTVLSGGSAEYDADLLWETAVLVLRDVVGQLDGHHRPVGIAVASMAEAGVLIDRSGSPVGPVIAWFDPRTEPEATWWAESVGVERTRRIAGVSPRPVFGASKMLWIQKHRPEQWAAGWRWLNMADWAVFRLSGETATDHSLASRTMLFDLDTRAWSDELVDASGLDRSKLAPLTPAGTPIGSITAAASAATGLPVGTVVGVGGHDHVCAALALGVTEPGMLLDSIGTAEAFFLVTDGIDRTGAVAEAGIGQGAHVQPGRTYAMTGLQQGGGRIDTRRVELGLEWDDFLNTPDADAIIDEVAQEGQQRIEAMLTVTDTVEVRHLATGGGSRNRRLIEQKQKLGGRPIEVADQMQATALGAAKLARRAVGGTR